jgi:hypothetical protein
MLSCIAAVAGRLDARAREPGGMEQGGCRSREVVARFQAFQPPPGVKLNRKEEVDGATDADPPK